MSLPLEQPRDPLVPRPIDLPRAVPLDGPLDELDGAKILAAPDDPADWPAWRDGARALARRRRRAHRLRRQRATTSRSSSGRSAASPSRSSGSGTSCSTTTRPRRFTPERFLAEGASEFGGFDGVVLWHAYPVIGIDERNQFDFYRDVPGIRELVAAFHARGVRVFVDYNPWDVGTRREAVDDATAIADARPASSAPTASSSTR